MTAIILICFGTTQVELLSNADFFRGARCFNWQMRCQRMAINEYQLTREAAERVCRESWE